MSNQPAVLFRRQRCVIVVLDIRRFLPAETAESPTHFDVVNLVALDITTRLTRRRRAIDAHAVTAVFDRQRRQSRSGRCCHRLDVQLVDDGLEDPTGRLRDGLLVDGKLTRVLLLESRGAVAYLSVEQVDDTFNWNDVFGLDGLNLVVWSLAVPVAAIMSSNDRDVTFAPTFGVR